MTRPKDLCLNKLGVKYYHVCSRSLSGLQEITKEHTSSMALDSSFFFDTKTDLCKCHVRSSIPLRQNMIGSKTHEMCHYVGST